MSITRFQPMRDLVSLRDAMDRLFEDSFVRPGPWTLNGATVAVPVDLWETGDAYHLRADVPGIKPDDLEINVTNDTVTITGEVRAATDVADDGWLRQERRTGKFARSFTLPIQIESSKVDATFENGVLHLTLPKAESVRPKTVKIRTPGSQ